MNRSQRSKHIFPGGSPMSTRIIVTGSHSEEGRQRFQKLKGAEIVFADRNQDILEEDLAECEIYVGNMCTPQIIRFGRLRGHI